jgi:photosystem II stability/assembly factor-like uncharacterized protein
MNRLKQFLTIALVSASWCVTAQTELDYWKAKQNFLDTYSAKIEKEKAEGKEDAILERFHRWTYFMENRIDPSTGACFDPTILWKEKQAFLEKQNTQKLRTGNSDWVSLGPTSPYDLNNTFTGRLGRVNSITIHPNDTNTIFLGTPNGGIWKTTNAGATWSSNTDQLDNISIADIVINPSNPQIMYAGTGDGFGYIGSSGFWGGTYSNGVIKSIDGGATWQTTGLSYVLNGSNTIRSMAIDPINPDVVYAATSSALMKTVDAGATWSTVLSGSHFSVEFNPKNPSTMYAISNTLRKSYDGGQTWNIITPTFATSAFGDVRNYLGVCHGDTNRLYFLFGKQDQEEVFKSADGGTTWTSITAPLMSKNFSTYGYFASVLEVDPNNDNKFLVGGVHMYESSNAGSSYNEVGANILHADHRAVTYSKSQPGLHYIGCDGGFYKRRGSSLTMPSEGLVISQIYNIALNPENHNNFYIGLQDNGNKGKKGNAYIRVTGADGMENLVDITDTNHTYHTIQYGSLYESFDGGLTTNWLNNAAPQVWILPLLQEHSSPFSIYQGGNGGIENLSTGQKIVFGAGDMLFLSSSAKYQKRWLAGTGKKVYSSFKGGDGPWKDITGTLTGVPNYMLDIAASNNDTNVAYAVFGGFSAGKKVYRTSNNGSSWDNITGTLPNIPVNTVVEGHDSLSTIYIGTDLGVFYRDKFMTDWLPFNKNLPNVIVTDLRIAEDANYIYAATYGRGAWRSPTQYKTSLFPLGVNNNEIKSGIVCFPNPIQNQLNIRSEKAIKAIRIYDLSGKLLYTNATNSASVVEIAMHSFSNGIYHVQIEQADGAVANKKVQVSR